MQDRPEATTEAEGAKRGEGIIGELAKKAVASSVSALLSSEEGIRALIGAIVPREVGAYVGKELSVLRAEFLKALTVEMSRFLERIDPATEMKKIVDGLTFDVHMTVSVSKRDAAADGPAVRMSVAPAKRAKPVKASRKAS
jgi:hypothetical protein